MKIAVVGRGLIGTAAARHLSAAGHEVVLIGPGEPEGDWSGHDGVFSSHYDEGRITRVGDPTPFFARASAASIARYDQIEAESGISFFTRSGAVIAGGAGFMAGVRRVRDEHAPAPYTPLDHAGLTTAFPFLAFPAETEGDLEPAGHISPRNLLTAQLKLASAQGTRLVPNEALSVTDGQVQTRNEIIICNQVIVAAGGWTDALLNRTPQHSVYARTVAFHEISDEEANRLKTMPSIVLREPDVYILPPIRYPDGRLWLKLGGDPDDLRLKGRNEINEWFRLGGNKEVGDYLTGVIETLIPGLRYTDRRIAPCVTTFAEDGLPEIARIGPGLTVAAAAAGAGAKCSDELGRMAAEIATKEET